MLAYTRRVGTHRTSTEEPSDRRPNAGARAWLRDLIDPDDPHTRVIRLEQLKLAALNSDASLAKMPVMTSVIAGGLAVWSPWLPLLLWWAVMNVSALATRRFLAACLAAPMKPSALKAATLRFFWVNTAQMIVFVAVAPIGYPAAEPMGQAMVMLVLAATMASVSSITGPCRPIFISDMLPICIVATVTPVALSGWEGLPPAVLAALFALLMYDNAKGAYAIAENALKLNDQNEALIAKLRASDQAKSAFLANMSHELRTPLNAILGFSEVMKDEMLGPIGGTRYKSYAGDIHASGQHLLGLVNDILDLARIESGRVELSDDHLSISRIVGSSFTLFQLQAERAGVSLRTDIDGDVVVRWDQRSARQIVLNLMSNALKFTPAGGSITISASSTASGVALTFGDTGCGIAPELHETIFESFGQGRHELAVQEKGTGLGLAIVKGLVELQGGRLTVESAVGKGAAFTIHIPPDRVIAVEPLKAAA